MTYSHTLVPEEPTLERARAEAAMMTEVVAYFRDNGVRVVNMSWGGNLRSIEEALEAHNAGGNAEQRRALAREIYLVGDIIDLERMRVRPQFPDVHRQLVSLLIHLASTSTDIVFIPGNHDYQFRDLAGSDICGIATTKVNVKVASVRISHL